MVQDSVLVRDHEREQFIDVLRPVVDDYRGHDAERMQRRADVLDEYLGMMERDDGAVVYDLGAETWETIITALDGVETTRASWLRTKLARRADGTIVQMGFTTSTPIGVRLSGQQPSVPDRKD